MRSGYTFNVALELIAIIKKYNATGLSSRQVVRFPSMKVLGYRCNFKPFSLKHDWHDAQIHFVHKSGFKESIIAGNASGKYSRLFAFLCHKFHSFFGCSRSGYVFIVPVVRTTTVRDFKSSAIPSILASIS